MTLAKFPQLCFMKDLFLSFDLCLYFLLLILMLHKLSRLCNTTFVFFFEFLDTIYILFRKSYFASLYSLHKVKTGL